MAVARTTRTTRKTRPSAPSTRRNATIAAVASAGAPLAAAEPAQAVVAAASRKASAKTQPVPEAKSKPEAKTKPEAKPKGSAEKARVAGKGAGTARKTNNELSAEEKVRDRFSMPQADHALIAVLKKRAKAAGRSVRKNELLRAGLRALHELDEQQLLQAVARLYSAP